MLRSNDDLRVIFLGMTNDTSAAVLETLLGAGVKVCAVVVGSAGGARAEPIVKVTPPQMSELLPIVNPFLERNVAHIAWERGITVFELRRPQSAEALAAFAALRPDVACVACFPKRIHAPLLAVPPLGFLNMHPSLLPAHRGPEPLFWTFHSGESQTGVTIHFMDAGLDTGDIAAQAPLILPDGISGADAERLSAALGGRLMVEVLGALAAGTLARRPQSPGGAYEPSPMLGDFRLNVDWPARRAFNFMRGTAEWGQPYMVNIGGEELALAEAIEYQAEGVLGAPYARVGDQVWVRFAPGVARARLRRDP